MEQTDTRPQLPQQIHVHSQPDHGVIHLGLRPIAGATSRVAPVTGFIKLIWLFRILYAGFAGLNEFSELSVLSYSPKMFVVNIYIQDPIEPKNMNTKVSIQIEKAEFGYFAHSPEIADSQVQGDTFDQVVNEIKAMIQAYLDSTSKPAPNSTGQSLLDQGKRISNPIDTTV